jgi:SAM-dependent methyltransferase
VTDDYEYRGLIAQAWDVLRGDTSGWDDRPFYLAAIRAYGEPALDVGCGTGRLLLDYLEQGIDIDGVDNSPDMLALCREKAARLGLRPNLHLQPMEALVLPRRYRTIIVPSSSFQLVLDPADASRAMAGFFGHLELGGALVMPFLVLGRDEPAGGISWVKERIRPDGSIVRRHAFARYDPTTQLEHTRDVYEVIRHGEVVEREEHRRSPATRSYTLEQAERLYRDAGFTVERIVGGFTDSPFDADRDEIFTIVGRRPEEG